MPELRTALDLTEQWDVLDNGSALITGVVVARRDVVEAHPQAVERFLEQYAAQCGLGQRQHRRRRGPDRGVRYRGCCRGGEGPAGVQHRMHHRQGDEGELSGYLRPL